MFKSLPIELYYKILNFGIIEPLHYVAYKTAKIRPVFSCELNSNICKEIITLDEENDENYNIDVEYYQGPFSFFNIYS